MSRVARGGSRGGGRGGRSKAGNTKIAGVEIAYDEGLEESLRHRPQPTPLFPVSQFVLFLSLHMIIH